MNFACLQTLAPDIDFVQHRHHHWSFAVCNIVKLSATELSQSPQLVFGTVYSTASRNIRTVSVHILQSSESTQTSFSAAFLDCFLSCLSSDSNVIFRHASRSSSSSSLPFVDLHTHPHLFLFSTNDQSIVNNGVHLKSYQRVIEPTWSNCLV